VTGRYKQHQIFTRSVQTIMLWLQLEYSPPMQSHNFSANIIRCWYRQKIECESCDAYEGSELYLLIWIAQLRP
jgi:hypothetical protein